jgi:hypothetical protein
MGTNFQSRFSDWYSILKAHDFELSAVLREPRLVPKNGSLPNGIDSQKADPDKSQEVRHIKKAMVFIF